jgi:hypothetical protein
MNKTTLSKWQAEVLREAFAILARDERARFNRPETPSPGRDGKRNSRAKEELAFAI